MRQRARLVFMIDEAVRIRSKHRGHIEVKHHHVALYVVWTNFDVIDPERPEQEGISQVRSTDSDIKPLELQQFKQLFLIKVRPYMLKVKLLIVQPLTKVLLINKSSTSLLSDFHSMVSIIYVFDSVIRLILLALIELEHGVITLVTLC